MVRWVGAWLLVAALGLLVARLTLRPRQDTWMLVASGRDESVLVAQYTVGNTGVLAEQLTTRITLLRMDGSPLAHRAVGGPATLDATGVHGALDGVERRGERWDLRVEGSAMRVRARTGPLEPGCPPRPANLDGVLEVPDISASSEGTRLDADAVLVRVRSHGARIASSALYAIDGADALGVDPLADCPGFLVLDGAAQALEPGWLPPDPDPEFELSLGGHRVRVKAGWRAWQERAFDGALLPEAWIARAVGYHEPDVTLRRVRVTVDDRPPWSGVLIQRDSTGRAVEIDAADVGASPRPARRARGAGQ